VRRSFLFFMFLLDLAALLLGFAVAAKVVFGTWVPWDAPLHGEDSIWELLILMVTGLAVGSYLSVRMSHVSTRRPLYGRAVVIVVIAVAFTMAGIVVTRGYWSRPFLGWSSLVWLGGVLLGRFVVRRRPWTERVVVVSDQQTLVSDLQASPHLLVLAVLDPDGAPPPAQVADASLVLDLRSALSDEMAQFVATWGLSGSPVRSIAEVYEEHLGRLPIAHIAHGWELTTPVSKNEYEPLKRILDFASIVILAPVWLPLAGLIALAIRLDSPGRVVYRQVRLGRHGKPFTLYKFRTMVDNAEEDGPRFAERDDPRLTRVGRRLRRFRADELPQLWNVLRGDLSLIGPRPERPHFAAEFEREIPLFAYRTLVRPGVTGWAQVNYGYADDLADAVEKLTFDLYYVKHMSLWLDVQILGRSVWTVLSGFGAR